MVEDGADIIDVGGESTRPGAKEVGLDEELRRTIPVIKAIRTGKRVIEFLSDSFYVLTCFKKLSFCLFLHLFLSLISTG